MILSCSQFMENLEPYIQAIDLLLKLFTLLFIFAWWHGGVKVKFIASWWGTLEDQDGDEVEHIVEINERFEKKKHV